MVYSEAMWHLVNIYFVYCLPLSLLGLLNAHSLLRNYCFVQSCCPHETIKVIANRSTIKVFRHITYEIFISLHFIEWNLSLNYIKQFRSIRNILSFINKDWNDHFVSYINKDYLKGLCLPIFCTYKVESQNFLDLVLV